jgi:transcriptional regulator with XRE-family HTH domain
MKGVLAVHAIDVQKIKELREKHSLSQGGVALSIGLSRPTYALVEQGENDLTVQQLLTLASVLMVEPEELIPQLNTLNEQSLTTFKQLILNCISYGGDSDDHKITKTKLAKLVYFADFNWYRKTSNTSISNFTYRSIQRGPVADQYFSALDEMFEEDRSIAIESRNTALMISTTEQVPKDRLTTEQLNLIKEICDKWRDKPTAEIVEFTHQQLPWKTTQLGDLISYQIFLQEAQNNLF